LARTTLQATLAELFALLSTGTDGTPETALVDAGCTKVYPHEPGATGVVKPCSVTISPAGIEPLDWRIAVRVYVDDQHPERAQDLLIEVPVAVDSLLKPGLGYGPSRWDMGWVEEIGCWAATCELMVGREDGF
jgi:hypothetical protein